MAAISWRSPVSGDWETPANWSSNTIPRAGDDVTIATAGSYVVTITLPESEAVQSLTQTAATLRVSGSLAISGASSIGSGATLDGNGTVSGSGTLINQGVIAADQASGLLSVSIANLTNQGIFLLNGGNSFYVTSPSFTNLVNNTLTGGVYEVDAPAGQFPQMRLLSSTIVTLQATVTLNGTGAILESFDLSGSVQIDNTLATIGTLGVLNLLGGRNFVVGTTLQDDGRINLAGGIYSGGLKIGTTGNLVGFGTVGSNGFTDAGLIEAQGGTLTLQTDPGGGGTLQADVGAVLALQGGTVAEKVIDNGVILVKASPNSFGATLGISGPISGAGAFQIQGGVDAGSGKTTLSLAGAAATRVIFGGPFATLSLGAPGSFSGTLGGFTTGDAVDLTGIDADTATLQGSQLLIKRGSTLVDTLNIDTTSQDYSHATFNASSMLPFRNFTEITVTGAVACFVRGTRIATPSGQVAVERLAIGDLVSTEAGASRPVKWIGWRSYAGAFIAHNRNVLPVVVREGALRDGVPQRDLHLSPKHALYLDGVLIPAEALINGSTIMQRSDLAEVEYYHVELDQHDVVFAEGAPAESFVDCESRSLFQNAAEFHALYPEDVSMPFVSCAERVEYGEVVEAVRRRLGLRAGLQLPAQDIAPGRLVGYFDEANYERLLGWAYDEAHSDQPVRLEIVDGDVVVARVLANLYRPDVESSGFGSGRCGFVLERPGLSPLDRHVLRVRRAADGAELTHSPRVLEATPALEPARIVAFESAMRATTAAAQTAAELDRTITFLDTQLDELLLARTQLAARAGPMRERGNPRGQRVLVIDQSMPTPDYDAGSVAVIAHMQSLQRLGFKVVFIAASPADDETAENHLAALGIECLMRPLYRSVEEALRSSAGAFNLVYLHRQNIADAYLALVRMHCPNARVLFSVADLAHLRLARQAVVQGRPDLRVHSEAVKQRELLAAAGADAVITHSSAEAAILRLWLPRAEIHVVPWAVPVRASNASFDSRHGLAFVGGHRHAPNRDAAAWLVHEIMPLVWQTDPSIECLLVGSDPHFETRALARHGVSVIGHMADLSSLYERVRLTVAPLRFGAGLKGKVVESLAAGVPCVMSRIAAEGIEVSGELTSLVGLDAQGIARAISAMHGDRNAHSASAAAGLEHVRRRYAEPQIDDLMRAAAGVRPAAMRRTG